MKWFRRSSSLGADTSITLTEIGRDRAEKFSTTGGRWELLATLREHGTCSLEELANESRYNVNQIKAIVKSLIQSGYVKRIRSVEDD